MCSFLFAVELHWLGGADSAERAASRPWSGPPNTAETQWIDCRGENFENELLSSFALHCFVHPSLSTISFALYLFFFSSLDFHLLITHRLLISMVSSTP
jgi:hypothetical protein